MYLKNQRLHIIILSFSIIFSLPVYAAGDYIWFWEKAFWQDRNEATPLDRKFYDDSLKFKFCNTTQKLASIAIAYWKRFDDNEGDFFITKGWWKVKSGECKIPFHSGGLISSSFYLNIQVDGQSVTDKNFKTAGGDVGGTMGCVKSDVFYILTHKTKWGKGCEMDQNGVPFLELKSANKHNEYNFTYE